ncbi:hypothetical protein C7974DRAFT_384925 [Boeremia exigua]|uniref:uncharacterized protein n=1 Tax=Boeremia exigua TaxID=749465 RepID=UPI001E8D3A75|nr:uncharacterized protein C7974DRAFT_384925 [Boeremia exigua]KAH6642147.1 hypothetical protein C7974DRAFT_384925 [Boeremia exigua]
MAATAPATSSSRSLSLTKFISRLRGHKSKESLSNKEPETGPTDTRPPLINSPLPLVLPEHQQALSNLGWTTVTFPQPDPSGYPSLSGPHPLQTAYEALFAASQAFFAQPAAEKAQWKHRLGSEEGWSSIPGEKEFITLRTLEYCPEILREPAKRYWDLMGAYLEDSLGRIAVSLDLPEPHDATKGLKRFVGPCGKMQQREDQKTASMLRLFRYEGWEAKEVAEPHADLGLLSAVVGDVPGLEVWDGEKWFEVEREVKKSGMHGASLLAGRQLEVLSNGRYPAGGHRVVSYGDAKGGKDGEKRYRFSIVFVLRAYGPVVINSDDLETVVTGKWLKPVHGQTAGEMYANIRSSHFNVNIGIEEREKQKQTAMKAQEQGGSS